MTAEGLKRILTNSEGTEIEYKKSQTGLARSVYESICAFLNRRGGHVVLGADDDGTILGIQPDKVQDQLDTLAKDMNNPQVMNPTFYLNYEPLEVDGKKVIYFYVPESSQAHNHKGVYYDRNQDGDFALKNNQQVADLMLRKQSGCSENRVLPFMTLDDFENEMFDKVRKQISLNRPGHLWATMTNHEILVSAGMWLKDPMTGKDGYTLAAALLFGKERTLTSVVPFYKIDALCRRHNTDLYDARDLIHCNLLRAYDRLMTFGRQNLPEWPYIEGDQRKSLRDILMREVAMNLLIHAEYGSRHDSKLTIWKDRVDVVNWNIPYGYGLITLDNLRPHAKNPAIANFFAQLGIVEELGRGTRALFEYVPKISGGQLPVIEEKDEFRVVIPYQELADGSQNGSQNGPQNGPQSSEDDTQKVTPTDDAINERQALLLELIAANNRISKDLMCKEFGVKMSTIKRDLKTLGIKWEGPSRTGHWVRE